MVTLKPCSVQTFQTVIESCFKEVDSLRPPGAQIRTVHQLWQCSSYAFSKIAGLLKSDSQLPIFMLCREAPPRVHFQFLLPEPGCGLHSALCILRLAFAMHLEMQDRLLQPSSVRSDDSCACCTSTISITLISSSFINQAQKL